MFLADNMTETRTYSTLRDLGLTAESVEKELDDKFHLSSTWDCVLLLDEADVFLAQRTKQDLQRNALVSGKSKNPPRSHHSLADCSKFSSGCLNIILGSYFSQRTESEHLTTHSNQGYTFLSIIHHWIKNRLRVFGR